MVQKVSDMLRTLSSGVDKLFQVTLEDGTVDVFFCGVRANWNLYYVFILCTDSRNIFFKQFIGISLNLALKILASIFWGGGGGW